MAQNSDSCGEKKHTHSLCILYCVNTCASRACITACVKHTAVASFPECTIYFGSSYERRCRIYLHYGRVQPEA